MCHRRQSSKDTHTDKAATTANAAQIVPANCSLTQAKKGAKHEGLSVLLQKADIFSPANSSLTQAKRGAKDEGSVLLQKVQHTSFHFLVVGIFGLELGI